MATFLIGSYISHGHILDWIIHRQSDDLLQSTSFSLVDVIPYLCHVHTAFQIPKYPPVYKSTRNLKPLILRHSKKRWTSLFHKSPPLTQLTEFLRSALGKYAPVTREEVRSHRSSPGLLQCLNNYCISNARDVKPKGDGSSLA